MSLMKELYFKQIEIDNLCNKKTEIFPNILYHVPIELFPDITEKELFYLEKEFGYIFDFTKLPVVSILQVNYLIEKR